MKNLIWIKDFILHFIKRILQILLSILVSIICGIIYVVTYEPGTFKRVTKRKIRRIRFLTKVKLYIYKYLKLLFVFMDNDYLKRLYNKFHFLIDK